MTLKDSLDSLYCIVLGINKKETIFTVDLFILTSKPIKWFTETQTWVEQMHHIWTHIFLEIDLLSRSSQNIKICGLISYKHNDKKKFVN